MEWVLWILKAEDLAHLFYTYQIQPYLTNGRVIMWTSAKLNYFKFLQNHAPALPQRQKSSSSSKKGIFFGTLPELQKCPENIYFPVNDVAVSFLMQRLPLLKVAQSLIKW